MGRDANVVVVEGVPDALAIAAAAARVGEPAMFAAATTGPHPQHNGYFRSVRPTSLTASQRMHQPATYPHGHRADSQLWTQPGG